MMDANFEKALVDYLNQANERHHETMRLIAKANADLNDLAKDSANSLWTWLAGFVVGALAGWLFL